MIWAAFAGVNPPCDVGVDAGTAGTSDGEPSDVAEGCSWKTGALARALISCSPSCQCIDSAERQGMPISVATFCHIWSLNLFHRQHVFLRRRLRQHIPGVQPCELVLLLFVPDGTLLEVVLVAQAAGDGAPSGQTLCNVVPLHSLATQLNGEVVLLGRPLGLLLGRALVC